MRNLITSMFILFIAIACHKSDNHYHAIVSINDSIKSLMFKSGSYWIYTSANNSNIDCTYVSNFNQGIYEAYVGLGRYENIEYYSNDYISTLSNEESNFTTRIELSYMLVNPESNYPWGNDPVLYTYSKSIWNWHNNGKYKYYDSLTITNNIYYHVQECCFLSNSDSITFITDPNIGVIKKIIHNQFSIVDWNLIRWKIVK